jgi:pyruvate dehydrogenase E1 component alpha subunit
VLAVYSAAREAVDRARSGDGPTLIECVTYRMSVHTTADDPKRYRKDEEVEEWVKRDPIARFQKYLVQKGLLTEEAVNSLEDEIKGQIKDVEKQFEDLTKEPGDPLAMFDHLYAEMPSYLREQREELKRELAEKMQGGG